MTNVFIRHEDDAKGVLLCHCEVDRLDWLLQEVGRWGVYHEGETHNAEDLSGQFVYGDGEAYFELVIATPDKG